MFTVKRYANRRLYDTSGSAYITLADIAARIRAGEDVRIVDARTDEDLTPQVLAQIIFEDRDAARLLPPVLLHQLIRMGDDSLAEFFSRYVTWALDVYVQARRGVAALQLNPGAGAAWGGFNPLAAILGGAGRAEPASDEVAALRREVEELKKMIAKTRR